MMQRTPLYEEHVQAGARLVPFAGWEMPVQYSGVIAEVAAVREGCGIFDVSHMGQLRIEGEGATEGLERIVSSDWNTVAPGRAAYALLLNEEGGVIDDVMGYRLDEDAWLVVVNASRAAVDESHFRAHLPAGVLVENGFGISAMIAVQGTKAQETLQKLIGEDLNQVLWRDVILLGGGAEGVLARGGYTGCDGFEIMFNVDDAPVIWNTLLSAGAVPCGLGARDVLRLEAGLPLYGHELREEWTPLESGCGWAVKIDKDLFIGRDALLRRGAPSRRIRALKMSGKAIPREGYAVKRNGRNHWRSHFRHAQPDFRCRNRAGDVACPS
jgi:aminomethyltransferase